MNNSQNKISGIIFVLFIVIALCIVVYQVISKFGGNFGNFNNLLSLRQQVEISIIYAPESESYMKDTIAEFNDSYARGVNPITGKALGKDEKQIVVTGKNASSGTIKDNIVNAVLNKSGDKEQPTVFAPSVSHWLYLVNYETNREIFKQDEMNATAKAPVVMAIWESRLNLLKAKYGNNIGWEELLKVLNSPNGWRDYSNDPNIRKRVYYGHTDPSVSSTALSTLIMEYTASAKDVTKNQALEQITLQDAQNPNVQQKVRNIEQLIRHYSTRTTEFKQYIAQGPDYLDFVALEENDLIYINQGKTEYKPPEKLVALYPKEGTFIDEHPYGIVHADWVTQDQTDAAKVFEQYVLGEKVQQRIMENGFRPVNPKVQVGYPISKDLGVDPAQPAKILKAPAPQVIATVQDSWDLVKKKSDVILLLDVSGSMDGDKIENAKKAIQTFAENVSPSSRLAFTTFSDVITSEVPLDSTENNRNKVILSLNEVQAGGNTSLYDSVLQSITDLEKESDSNTIHAIVILSDGQDTTSKAHLSDVTSKLNALQREGSSILVIPIAYGSDADIKSLESIARSSKTILQQGDTKDITKLLETISSYF